MKNLVILIAAVTTSMVTVTSLRAQPQAATPAPETASEGEVQDSENRDLSTMPATKARSATARPDTARPQRQVQVAQAGMAAGAGSLGGGGDYSDAVVQFNNIVNRGPSRPDHPLVIRSSNMEPREQANLEEDLAVMTHILDKALENISGSQSRSWRPMGINVVFAPGSPPMRSFYLEGYGVLFFFNVGFPLLAPPTKADAEKAPANSTWEEAKQEMYGQAPEGRTSHGPAEEFDEDKLSKLQEAVLEALKNATNIHALKPDDSVTVCVFGGASSGFPRFRSSVKRKTAGADEPNEVLAPSNNGVPPRATTMTIRVKKADVDALAQGKLNAEEFGKRATVAKYAGNPVTAAGAFSFGGFGGGGGGGGSGMRFDWAR